ncbi:MAG TPA: SDR family oxidoreductase [Planctomycetota bacterium]|nr:SDR family oxidoreductase [Planctomycetota bacterium]
MSPAILVTGGGGGIGAAVVRRACAAGWFTWVAGRDAGRLEATVKDVRSRGGNAATIELDVANPDSCRRACEKALLAAAEPIAGLVNCAGIAISAPLLSGDPELHEKHFAVNFHGARRMIEALAPRLRENKHGRIVNVASSAGLRGYAYAAAYCASKHALIGYTRAAALELAGSGVSIAAVCPHYVDSPLTDASVERLVAKTKRTAAEARAFLARQNPGGRLISCEEVADAVWSLIEGGENGTILELDGARTLRVEGAATVSKT